MQRIFAASDRYRLSNAEQIIISELSDAQVQVKHFYNDLPVLPNPDNNTIQTNHTG